MLYIQTDVNKKYPINFDSACAMYGAIESNINFCLITLDELSQYYCAVKNNCFVGTVEFMQKIWETSGISDKIKLPKNSNRPSEIITLEEALFLASEDEPRFIKPAQTKLFDGFVLDKCKYSCLEEIPLETKVYAYQPFEEEITTEWRFYIHNHKIVGSGNYSGDYWQPHCHSVEKVIKENESTFPIAYTIDVGVLESGRLVVIEFNDAWSIGNYGLDNVVYLQMLKDRYFEIVRKIGNCK